MKPKNPRGKKRARYKMKNNKKVKEKVIRSELTHEQEVSLTPPELSWDVIKRINDNLKALEKRPKTSMK